MDKAAAQAAIDARYKRVDTDDLYAYLDVPRDADTADIRAAYRALAREFHLDRMGRLDLPTETMKRLERVLARLGEASQTLSHDERRHAYDEEIEGGGRVSAAEMEAIFAAEESFRRGKLNLERGQYQAALEKFESVVQVNPDDPTSLAYLHFARFTTEPVTKKGERSPAAKKALAELERLAEENQKLATPPLLAGKALKLSGQEAAAKRMFKRVMRIQPRNADAERELRLIQQRSGAVDDSASSAGFMDKLRGFFGKK